MKLNRKQLRTYRARILRSTVDKEPDSVFAQRSEGDSWHPVSAIKVIGGIVWVTLHSASGSWMAFDVQIRDDLKNL